ncbi:MAG: DNA ligase-associated DEXH box helicase, partial [Chloroflexales bacterium]|nr:DNA ligase-associated DEXH box helicase [Chloroflexales bacterium]
LEFVRVRDMVAWVRRAGGKGAVVPRWSGSRQPISTQLAAAVRAKLEEARQGVFDDPEMERVRPILALQAKWSKLPQPDELLVERVKTREGHHLFFYPFEGRLVHEGLAALLAYRIGRLTPISFTLAANDYGFELLSPTPIPLGPSGEHRDSADMQPSAFSLQPLLQALLSPEALLEDTLASLNATELARRQFREIARVAGLVFQGFPGSGKSAGQMQASSGLLYDVFSQYDPDNLLLVQARREVIERQLEQNRLGQALRRIAAGRISLLDVQRPTPLAFPLLVDRLREAVSSEQLADRVRRMLAPLEKAAG